MSWPRQARQVMQAGEAAALALPVADRVLDELERRVLPEVADREHRLEDRLQAGVFAFRRQAVHLQEPLVRLLLNLDQVRDRDGRLDLAEVDALAVDVFGETVHALNTPRTGKSVTGDALSATCHVRTCDLRQPKCRAMCEGLRGARSTVAHGTQHAPRATT
jgi:hypothetical protein